MSTRDSSQLARVKRRRGVALANFHGTNPSKQLGGPLGTDEQTIASKRTGLGLFFINNAVAADNAPTGGGVQPGPPGPPGPPPPPPPPAQLWVAAGANTTNGVLLTSPNSVNWTSRVVTAFSGGGINQVAYGGGRFVAVGNTTDIDSGGGAVSSSADGVTWSISRIDKASCLYMTGVAYGNNLWVAVGVASGGGILFTSEDSITWVDRTPNIFNTGGITAVIYTGSKWIINGTAGGQDVIASSTNGIAWTSISMGDYVLAGISRVSYNTSTIFAYGNTMLKSENMAAWEQVIFTDNTPVTGMSYSESKWVILSRNVGAGSGKINISTDNVVTWSPVIFTAFDGGIPKGLSYFDSKWVAFGTDATDNVFTTSTTGETWTTPTPLKQFAGGNLNTIIYA